MNNPKKILLVEDDRVDVMTIKRAMRQLKLENPLDVAGNGIEALELLRQPEAILPSLILLDINMPRMNGLEFLKIIKEDKELRRIPVVILTTSREQRDRFASFDASVAGYMVKPVEYEEFVNVVGLIHSYWQASETSNNN